MPKDGVSTFEQWVLLALVRLKDNAYGRTIHREIEARASLEVPIGQVYASLERLESKGFVLSAMGEPSAIRGGRAKRYFSLTPGGGAALRDSLRSLDQLRAGLEGFTGVAR